MSDIINKNSAHNIKMTRLSLDSQMISLINSTVQVITWSTIWLTCLIQEKSTAHGNSDATNLYRITGGAEPYQTPTIIIIGNRQSHVSRGSRI